MTAQDHPRALVDFLRSPLCGKLHTSGKVVAHYLADSLTLGPPQTRPSANVAEHQAAMFTGLDRNPHVVTSTTSLGSNPLFSNLKFEAAVAAARFRM